MCERTDLVRTLLAHEALAFTELKTLNSQIQNGEQENFQGLPSLPRPALPHMPLTSRAPQLCAHPCLPPPGAPHPPGRHGPALSVMSTPPFL